MKEAYEKSLQMIKESRTYLTKKQYSKLAKKYNLLNVVSLEFMSKKTFHNIIKDIVEEVA